MDTMQFKYLKIPGGQVAYLGSLANDKALLFIGRSNPTMESAPLQTLINRLVLENYVVLCPIDRARSIVNFLNKKSARLVQWIDAICGPNESLIKNYLRKITKAIILAFYPSKWDHFFTRERRLNTAYQSDFYRRVLRSVGKGKAISVLSHSAGGRIACHLSDESNLERLICFGYPFKHPDKQEEPERTDNLKRIQKPFLIIQGAQDEYGGTDVTSRYALSACIGFEFVNSDHNYENISDGDWSRIINRIESFLDSR